MSQMFGWRVALKTALLITTSVYNLIYKRDSFLGFLRSAGVEYQILSFRTDCEPINETVIDLKVPVDRVSSKDALVVLRMLFICFQMYWRGKKPVVYCQGVKAIPLVGFVCLVMRIKYFVMLNGLGSLFHSKTSIVDLWFRKIVANAAGNAYGLYFHNNQDRERLIELNPKVRNVSYSVFLGSGVDLDLIVRKRKNRSADFHAVWVGRDHPDKRLDIFLDLVARFPSRSFALCCATEKPTDEFLEEISALPNLKIFLNLDQPAALDVMVRSRFLIHTSMHEGSAQAVAEALCLGVPVIARDIPGNSELIMEKVTGILVSNDDEFVRAFQIALTLPNSEYRAMQMTCRSKAIDLSRESVGADMGEAFLAAYG